MELSQSDMRTKTSITHILCVSNNVDGSRAMFAYDNEVIAARRRQMF